MRHLKAGRKLNRTAAHRKMLMRNLVKALIQREQIRTTDAKAKELRRWADRMVTLGKKGTLHARRLAFSYLGSRRLVQRLFDEVTPRFAGRSGGYTRVLKIGPRRGDAAPISVVEFTVRGEGTTKKVEETKGSTSSS
ncbi:MAG TPA: 50S ribosomal protein L17 [Candidatus Binatia bacterium]|nr:50S ribosomal protein L17 [Candidatus Binatia bacterium]